MGALGTGAAVVGAAAAGFGIGTVISKNTGVDEWVGRNIINKIPGLDLGGAKKAKKNYNDMLNRLDSEGRLTPWGTPQGEKGFFVNHQFYNWGPGGHGDYSTYPGGAAKAKKDQKDEGDPVYGWSHADMGDPVPEGNAGGAMSLRGPGRVQGMNSDFVNRLAKMFADNPKLSLTSGFRTRAEQEKLYREKPHLAAKPGSSKHEKGLAADIGPSSEYGWIAKNLSKYGLSLPMPSKEPWHVQPSGGVAGGAMAAADEPAAGSGSGEDAGSGGGALGIGSVSVGGGLGGPSLGQGNFIPLAGGGVNVAPHRAAAARAGASGTTKDAVASTGTTGLTGGAGGISTPATGKLTVEQVLRLAKGAGFSGNALQTIVAIAMSESGLRPDAQGDTGIQTDKWGPSVGLWQVRTLKAATGSGGTRDIQKLLADTNFQAKAAWEISGGGKTWQPWSVYTSGAYQKNMGVVRDEMSAKGIGDPVQGFEKSQRTVFVGGQQQGGGNITIHNLTIPVEIARGTPDEAERAARMIGDILTNRNRLMEIARK